MHNMYSKGLDQAKRTTSTKLPPMELPKSGVDVATYRRIAENNKLFGQCKSAGEVLGVRRAEKLRKQREARLKQQRLEAGNEEEGEGGNKEGDEGVPVLSNEAY